MRVVTFNICHGTRGRGTAVDHDALVAACVGFDADVLALQEVDRGVARSGRIDQVALVADACAMAYAFVAARPLGGGEFGNALLVRGEVADVEQVGFRGRWRWGRRDRRAALLATASVEGDRLAVAVAHLSLSVLDNVPQERAVIERLARRTGPHLLLGDLNRRTAWVRPEVERAGLALVDDDAPTAPRTRPRYRIDHVAASGFDVTGVEVVDPGVSDHRALVVELAPVTPVAPGAPVA